MKSSLLASVVSVVWRLRLAPVLALILSSHAAAQATTTAQSKDLVPQKTDKGILFQCSAPGVSAVYLAGDFNNWANNTNSVISDPGSRMTGPDAKGIWQITVQIAPGDHSFKFCTNGTADGWFTPDWATDRDADGNGIIHVTDAGVPLLHSPVSGDWAPQQKDGKVTFQLLSPSATSVYIAGDFNNWASNNNGTATDAKCLMTKSDDGVWRITVPVPTGHHVYQFVVNANQWQTDPNGAGKDDQNHSTIDVK